jgi:Ca-activated chloride channel homolog
MRYKYFVFSLLILPFSITRADEYRNKINDGYDYYKSGEYDKAAEQFKNAGILKPDRALPSYDKGTALYKSNDFEGAANEFESSIGKNDPKFKSDALFNAGNAYFKAKKYDQAVKSYVDALKLNPKDQDYKHNLELSLRQMQQQQQQQQKQDKNKDNKQNQDQKKQDQQKQDQKKQDQDKQKQDQNQQQQNQQDQKKDQQQGSPQKQEMSQKQAKELLARFAEDEKDIQKRLKQVNVRGRSTNDW